MTYYTQCPRIEPSAIRMVDIMSQLCLHQYKILHRTSLYLVKKMRFFTN